MEISIYISKIVLILCVVWSIRLVVKAIQTKNITGYVFLLPVFILFFILPDIIDGIFGWGFNPRYSYIREATSKPQIQLYYNLYCIVLMVVFNQHFKSLSLLKKGRSEE